MRHKLSKGCNLYRKFGKGNIFTILDEGKGKGLPQQAEVAQGVPGRLRPQIFLTFGTMRVVGILDEGLHFISNNYSGVQRNNSIRWQVMQNYIQWKSLIMITLGPALFDNNNRLITLSEGYNNLHCLTQFIVTIFYMYKKQRNLFKKTYVVLPVVCLHLVVPE